MSPSFLWTPVEKKAQNSGDILDMLKRVPIFEDVSRRDLKAIERILHIRTYMAGEYIFREGDSGLGMYIIESGEVGIVSTRTGQEITRFREGEFFGEVALFIEQPRSASAVATKETVAWGFFQPDLIGLLQTHPKLAVSVVMKLTRIVAERLNRAVIENNRLTEMLAREQERAQG